MQCLIAGYTSDGADNDHIIEEDDDDDDDQEDGALNDGTDK